MPAFIDFSVMEVLAGTHGKTVHSWRFDARNLAVPIEKPKGVIGDTEVGQITPDFVKKRGAAVLEIIAQRP